MIFYVDDGKGSFKQFDSVVKEIVEKGLNFVVLVGLNMLDDKKVMEYFVKGMEFIVVFKMYKKEKVNKLIGL